MARKFSLRKSRQMLHGCYSSFKKKGKLLTNEQHFSMEKDLRDLEDAVFNNEKTKASELAKKLENFSSTHFKKKKWEYLLEIFVAIIFALLIATVVRQTWFEFYQIPTGSMRPSFREQDHLSVSKTAFGINVPLLTKHLYFDPDLIKRGNVVIFSGHHIPGMDADTSYFWVFPYKKRYIKRLIGKPGDFLYFYGGKIYGVDKDGNPIRELLEDPWMKKLEHIPFITFEGTQKKVSRDWFLFAHMGQPIGRLSVRNSGRSKGEIFHNQKWVNDQPSGKNNETIRTFDDFWGIKNFSLAKLLTHEEVEKFTSINTRELEKADLYLHLSHSPNLTRSHPKVFQRNHQYSGVIIPTEETVIPLEQQYIDAIMNHLYTARFEIKNGRAYSYSPERSIYRYGIPGFSTVRDGTYEFTHGKAEKVGLKGWTKTLPPDHPLYDKKRIQKLFNHGIEFAQHSDPFTQHYLYPSRRFAYFRDGDLYVMGVPVIKKEDPTLVKFLTKEKGGNPFIDHGPPIKNGHLDSEFIKAFGLEVPERHYFVLGDNHANSADSRVFGFVPEDNLQGAPSFLLWPPGSRWGLPPQSGYPFITLPRCIIWGLALIIGVTWYILHRRKMGRRLFLDIERKTTT